MSRLSVTPRAAVLSSCLLAVGLAGCGGEGSHGTRVYEDFTVGWDADTQTMSAVRTAEPRDVEGTYVRLSSSSVQWDGDTKELSGDVTVTNVWSGGLWFVEANIIAYNPSDQSITDDGTWYYPTLPSTGHSAATTWTFTDPNAVDFSFTVRVSFSVY